MELRPSDIFYSQDSIMNRFGDYTMHGNTYIGETLDELLQGYCNVNSIPTITVVKKYGKWYTSDNRRLWVFRKAEEIGFLETIDVTVSSYLNGNKFTTENGGTSIRVRGGTPGGRLWRSWKPKRPDSSYRRSTPTSYNLNTSSVLSSQRNTSPSYPVSNQTTNLYHQNTSFSNSSSMSSVYSNRSEQRIKNPHTVDQSYMGQFQSNYGRTTTYQPPRLPTVPSPTHTKTNRVSSPTIQNRSNYFGSYRDDSSNIDNRHDYTNSTNTRTMRTDSPYQAYGRGSSYADNSTDHVPSSSSSRHETQYNFNNEQSFQGEHDINNCCCTIL
ncbi:rac guanine nucleotide exchange factor JJ-like [Mytilus edulis]|uniref:rac guanine nucleotide exchange factor JJ-like n=1 Tax=Mytilus edulis TaxID=6550 RepID=UPI0039EDEF90